MFEVADSRPAGGDSDLSPCREPPPKSPHPPTPPNSYSKVGQYLFLLPSPLLVSASLPSFGSYAHTLPVSLLHLRSSLPPLQPFLLPLLPLRLHLYLTFPHPRTQNAYFCATVTQSPIATQTALILNQTAASPASSQEPVPHPPPPAHTDTPSSSSPPILLSPQAGSLSALCRMEGIFPLGSRHGLALNQL